MTQHDHGSSTVTLMNTSNYTACGSCGSLVDDETKFCPFCGTGRIVEHRMDGTGVHADGMTCRHCGEPRLDMTGKYCGACGFEHERKSETHGEAIASGARVSVMIPAPVGEPRRRHEEITRREPAVAHPPSTSRDAKTKTPDRTVAGILAILLGSLGAHKFYMGRIGTGILYLLFCWTGIPAIVGLIEGIMYLIATDEEFERKYLQ